MTNHSPMIALLALWCSACAGGRNEDRAATPQRPARSPVAETARVHEELTAAVEKLSSRGTSDRELERRALIALAKALESAVANETFAGDTVRELASKIGRSPDAYGGDGRLVHEAFTSVLATLAASSSPSSTTVEYRRALSALASAVEALGAGKGLTRHADEIVAFRSSTDAVYLLGGHAPPFHQAAAGDERSEGLKSHETEVAEARRDVGERARTSWTKALTAAARALTSLADAVESIEPCGPSPDVATVRFEARRMRWTRGAGVLQSRSIATGLSAVLDVLERVQTAGSSPATKAARVAVGNVNPYGSLAFQRAAVQDAFRATTGIFSSLPAPSARSCVRATRPAGDPSEG